ncbi:hypothetical protein IU451_29350 [Nocardia cyriacigeorgica]|uniref:hypothetical protein n=1 Tax=Nocardia cyriacigeorgica TaxID=135487 RepID=UPI001893F0E1|nr:hypothetical protein [Nocardia cyriacigeorgica]MBF6326608.1 hypothetical protein [Nocardia cyriacigeorgica]
MSLVTEVSDLATRIGTEFKTVRTEVSTVTGSLAALATTDKSNLVAAINEVAAETGGGGPITADNITDATVTGKALIRAVDAAAARGAIGAGTSNLALGTTSSTAKAGDYQPTAANISDSTATGRAVLTAASAGAARTALGVYSTGETDSAISTAVAGLVDAAPGTLDTLNELAAALGDDPSFATTINTALGNRVRVDTAAQGLTALQQGNARTNIGAVATADVGDTSTDYVAIFEAALL